MGCGYLRIAESKPSSSATSEGRVARGTQLDLFSPAPAEPGPLDPEQLAKDQQLIARLPQHVHFGTSSWSFPGWAGIVYAGKPTEKDLTDRGLEEYARHPLFSSVGIDRSYYAPLSAESLQRYAAQLPPGFPCVIKAFSEVTSRVHPRTREPNPHFFDVEAAKRDVVEPLLEHFQSHVGALVFELMPVRDRELPKPQVFEDELFQFLSNLPKGLPYAVELRNRQLFTHRYLEVLSEVGAGHVLNYWERMPSIGRQLEVPNVLSAPFVVSRVLIPPGQRYADMKQKFAPFDRIVEAQPTMRADIVKLSEACALLGKTLLVIVNNKAEGSSPLTVRALAEAIVDAPAEDPG